MVITEYPRIRCSKTFPGPMALTTTAKVSEWLHELARELEEVWVRKACWRYLLDDVRHTSMLVIGRGL